MCLLSFSDAFCIGMSVAWISPFVQFVLTTLSLLVACAGVWLIYRQRRDFRREILARCFANLLTHLIGLRGEHLEHFGDVIETHEFPDEAVADALAVPARHADQIQWLLENALSQARAAGVLAASRAAFVTRVRAAQQAYLHPKHEPDHPMAALKRLDNFIETLEQP